MEEHEQTGLTPGRFATIATEKSQYLSVDETRRQRANSDPGGLHIYMGVVPEITVTGEDGRDSGCVEDDELDSLLAPPSPRPRSNTCPEDLFRDRKGRPPTPPPVDLKVLRNRAGKRFSFNFSPKDIKNISFIHHKLSKVKEEKADSQQKDHRTEIREFSIHTETNSSHISSLKNEAQERQSKRDFRSALIPVLTEEASTDENIKAFSESDRMKNLSLTEYIDEESTNNNQKIIAERNLNPEVSPGVRGCADSKHHETFMTATA